MRIFATPNRRTTTSFHSSSPGSPSRALRLLAAVLCLLAVASTAVPSGADLSDEIEKLKRERAEIQSQQADKAGDVDAATAETAELTAALAALNQQVNETESRLEQAQSALEAAEARLAIANAEVDAAEASMETLEQQVAKRAITAFIDRGDVPAASLSSHAPGEATRAKTMVSELTEQDFDIAEDLRALQEDLAFKQARADAAQQEADDQRDRIDAELQAVAEARDAQATLTAEAEDRLDRQLAELAYLQEQDAELAQQQKTKSDQLAIELARAAAARNPAPVSSGSISYPSADQIVKVSGFWVHVDISKNLENMLAAAAADGHTFGGWGYRDHQTQIRLRKANCGTSQWAIYSKSSSSCRPPTARPGRSQHEQGKAIDFTYGGRAIGTRSSAGYKWLAQNAATYGFYNLPSEPWHWSVNGR